MTISTAAYLRVSTGRDIEPALDSGTDSLLGDGDGMAVAAIEHARIVLAWAVEAGRVEGELVEQLGQMLHAPRSLPRSGRMADIACQI